MKNRPRDKKAGIIILAALIIISLADLIFRAAVDGAKLLTEPVIGEQLITIALAAFIMLMTVKGKDRACYILYGAWASFFIFNQLFELPDMIKDTVSVMSRSNWEFSIGDIAFISRAISMIAIVAIGGLLVEYMTDGTIYNRAFNALCIVTVLSIVVNIALSVGTVIAGLSEFALLIQAIDNLYHITMVFLFAFFAYDSAKHQLKKANLSK